MNMIQLCVAQAIQDNPQAAAKEVPQILDVYVIDNTALNRVKDAAKRVLVRPDKFALNNLRRAVAEAEGRPAD